MNYNPATRFSARLKDWLRSIFVDPFNPIVLDSFYLKSGLHVSFLESKGSKVFSIHFSRDVVRYQRQGSGDNLRNFFVLYGSDEWRRLALYCANRSHEVPRSYHVEKADNTRVYYLNSDSWFSLLKSEVVEIDKRAKRVFEERNRSPSLRQ